MANTNRKRGDDISRRDDQTNDVWERLQAGHNTGQNFAHSTPQQHLFGAPEEIRNRVGGTYNLYLNDRHATVFKQIGPTGAQGNANQAKPKAYKNNGGKAMKFGSGIP
jgi:hypothetical protein